MEKHPASVEEREIQTMPEILVETIAPEGLGYGKGDISVARRREAGDLPASIEKTVEAEVRNPERHVAVEFNDDGCGDGRYTARLYLLELLRNVISETELKRNGIRAKIFGGGLIVGWIAGRALSGRISETDSVAADRQAVANKLEEAKIKFGGHTSDHASPGKTGCGAIDHAPEIIASAVDFAEKIKENVAFLRPDIFTEDRFAKVMEVFSSIEESSTYFGDGSIEETRKIFARSKAIIKELRGDHSEIRFVRNEVPGTTLDQASIVMMTNDIGEIFVDDAWRRDMYAEALGGKDEESVAIAAIATEVWTLAVAATLTDGTLPVDRVRMRAPADGQAGYELAT